MVTEIPWGDGSGDKIYLSRNASEGDQVVQVSSDANSGAARTKVVTFTSGVGNIQRQLTINQAAGGIPYQQVAYIRNTTVGDYIDTGITAGSDTRVIVWARNVNIGSLFLFGSRVGGSEKAFGFAAHRPTTVGGRMRFDYGTNNYIIGWGTQYFGWYHKYEIDGNVFKIDDVIVGSVTATTWSSSLNIHIFGLNNNGTHAATQYPVDISAAKIYKSGSLVRDMVAVKDGGIGKMYDKVTGSLYASSGGGSFTAGPDGTMEDLLSGYTQLEYATFSGNQYFNTGIKGSQSLDYNCIFRAASVGANLTIHGCQTSSSSKRYSLGLGTPSKPNTALYFRYNKTAYTTTINSGISNLVYLASKDANVIRYYYNYSQTGTATSTAGTFTTDYNIYVGASNNAGTLAYPFQGRIYFLQFGTSRAFVPVRNAQNVVGFYDTYNDAFYASDNSPFTA